MNLRSEKTLGLIGSVLVLLGVLGIVPYIGVPIGTVSLVGTLLILVALHGIGNKLGDERPFRNYLYSVVLGFAALVIPLVLLLIGALNDLEVGLVVAAVAMIALVIASAHYARKAWTAMYEITGTKEFLDAAKWTWWGALTIPLIIGLLLLLIANIFLVLAFANMPEELGEVVENARQG